MMRASRTLMSAALRRATTGASGATSSSLHPACLANALLTPAVASPSAGSPSPSSAPNLCFQQLRLKSTAPLDHDDEEEAALDATLNIDAASTDDADGFGSGSEMSNNTLESVADYTSDKSKSGTPSPWAVFDAWGAGADIVDPLSADEEYKLSKDSVAIPFTDEERAGMPDETSILGAYDHLLKRKSSVHFGYPYNLMYNHEEL